VQPMLLLVKINLYLPFYEYFIIGVYEYLLKKTTGRDIDVSRLFIYYNARAKNNASKGKITDGGCNPAYAIEALKQSGTCLESIWPYNVKRVNARPHGQAYKAARAHTIADALRLNCNLHDMKSCLAQGYPFVVGLVLFQSFNQAAKKGIVPMPKPKEQTRGKHGRFDLFVSER
jgi:hypothetical protein